LGGVMAERQCNVIIVWEHKRFIVDAIPNSRILNPLVALQEWTEILNKIIILTTLYLVPPKTVTELEG
jgi:hypothetical protein